MALTSARLTRRLPWWVGVFALGLATRLGFLWLADGPLVFGHERDYFNRALSIVEHPAPLSFVLRSDDWRIWGAHGDWTLPPLYQVFVAAFFAVWPSYPAVQLAQCLLGAAAAVGVGWLGRLIAPGPGAWAGVAYAVYWPAVVMASNTMTENLHTPLLVGGLVLLCRGAAEGRLGATAAGGFVLGVSALTRSVSTAFLPLAGLWHLRRGVRQGAVSALVLVGAGAAAVLPWTARNVLLTGEMALIDTVSLYNLWWGNLYVNEDRAARQERSLHDQPTAAARRDRALALTWRNVTGAPGVVPRKVWDNVRYFLRPDGLDNLLRVEYPQPGWLHAASVVLGDAVLLLAIPLFVVFAWAGRPSPARSLLLLWFAYYVLMLTVVFHVQLRYRSAVVPVVLAGAAGGLAPLRERGRAALAALAGGVLVVALILFPYVGPGWRAARAAAALASARAALLRGEGAAAESAAQEAARRDPVSARPWLSWGRALAAHGRVPDAIECYRRAEHRRPGHWVPLLALPQLLREAGRLEEYERALARADALAGGFDPWWALEVAWRELPAPRGDEILLARGDYGAVRGFVGARGDHRWSRHRAWLRLTPTRPSPVYDVTLEMGSPPPSPRADAAVTVLVPGSPPVVFRLGPQVRPYTVRARPEPGRPLLVELRAPTWNRAGQPPEQGVRVDRLWVVAP